MIILLSSNLMSDVLMAVIVHSRSSKLRSNPLRNSKVTTLSMELLYQTSNAPCQLNDLLHYSTK